MKKLSILLLGFILVAAPFAYSQDAVENQERERSRSTSTAQRADRTFTGQDYSSWSLYLDLGLNTFIGDMTIDMAPTFNNPLSHFSLGGGVEYTINPMFSIGLGYAFHRIAASDTRGSFESSVHNVFPYVGINLLNYPLFRRNNRWDLWFTAGFGFASYAPQLTYNEVFLRDLPSDPAARNRIINPEFGRASTGVIPLGVELSYDITRQLAIALKAQYFLYGADNLEGAPTKLAEFGDPHNRKNYTLSGTSNDIIATFGLALRWNIASRDRTHMRKVTWEDVRMPRVPDISGVLARLDTLENRMDNLRDDVEDFMRSPIIITEQRHGGETVLLNADGVSDPVFVFFAFDRHNLDHTALAEILKIATVLNENENLNVDIYGFTDIRGSVAHNQALSDRRANAVRNELVNVWGISPDRITHEGKGKAVSPQPNSPRYFSINRRAEVRFYRK